jgi:hypothetical protein
MLVNWNALVCEVAADEEKVGEFCGLSVGAAAATTVQTTTGAITDEPNMNAPKKLNLKAP